MSTIVDVDPLLLLSLSPALPCERNDCEATAVWSILWTCGEVILYCTPHLEWAKRESEERRLVCDHPGVDVEIPIFVVMVVPL